MDIRAPEARVKVAMRWKGKTSDAKKKNNTTSARKYVRPRSENQNCNVLERKCSKRTESNDTTSAWQCARPRSKNQNCDASERESPRRIEANRYDECAVVNALPKRKPKLECAGAEKPQARGSKIGHLPVEKCRDCIFRNPECPEAPNKIVKSRPYRTVEKEAPKCKIKRYDGVHQAAAPKRNQKPS